MYVNMIVVGKRDYFLFKIIYIIRVGHDFDFQNQNHDFKIKIMI